MLTSVRLVSSLQPCGLGCEGRWRGWGCGRRGSSWGAAGSEEEAAWKPLPMLLRLVVFLQPPTSLGSQPLQLSFLRALSLNSLRLSSCGGRDPQPGTSLTLRVLSDLLPAQAFEMGTCIILCLQMRKLKHRGEMTHSRPVVGRARN